MSSSQRTEARASIEGLFRATVDRDMTQAAAARCNRHDLRAVGGYHAAPFCGGSHEVVSELIWAPFLPSWDEVVYVYDGTGGEATRFLACKTLVAVEYALSGGHVTPRVRDAASYATRELQSLWRIWAGYMATTTDALAAAVSEFEVLP